MALRGGSRSWPRIPARASPAAAKRRDSSNRVSGLRRRFAACQAASGKRLLSRRRRLGSPASAPARAELVARHERQRQQQFVFDQLDADRARGSTPARRPRFRRRALGACSSSGTKRKLRSHVEPACATGCRQRWHSSETAAAACRCEPDLGRRTGALQCSPSADQPPADHLAATPQPRPHGRLAPAAATRRSGQSPSSWAASLGKRFDVQAQGIEWLGLHAAV